jgi:hypothetical protein
VCSDTKRIVVEFAVPAPLSCSNDRFLRPAGWDVGLRVFGMSG